LRLRRFGLEVTVRRTVTVGKPAELSKPKLSLGLANVLAQSEMVSRAFGPRLGFALMFTAVLATTGVSTATLIILARGIGRFL
jgi:hypothetical protein